MASGDYDTKITLGMEADLSGGVQTEKQLDQLKRKAREFGKDGESSLGQVQQAAGKLQKSIGFLRSALTGFGAVGAIMGLVSAIGKIRDSFKTATKEAEELARAKEKTERKEEIEKLAKSYEELGRAISKTAESLRRSNELQDIATKNARELEDAQLDLAEQKELAAVDASNPAAGEIRATISARYAAQRGARTSSRRREDVTTEYNRLVAEAGQKRAAAGKITRSLEEDDRLIKAIEKKIEEAERRAIQRNAKDIPAETSLHPFKNLYSLNWGAAFRGERTTEEGDAVRKFAREQAEGMKAELKSLKENREAKQREAETLRSEAEHIDKRAGAAYRSLQAVDVREQTARVTGQRGMDDAETSLEKKNKEIAKKEAKEEADRATIAQGPGRIAALQKKIDSVEAQKLAAQQADAKEQQDAILAQQALDSFNSAGRRRNGTGVQKQRSALEADVERETREAKQSRSNLNSTLAELAVELRALNADLNKVKREVDAARKRQAATNDEAPPG